ncbi:bacteriodes thetaiotaomicron symbiotic chitinase [Penicillium verhagenii]|uniref:bacteriodes thetaiotaomicron symbiotic chitinase n=1 Tax=Penicillium verhagenii TaxID=1562060 RepID=UPI002545BA4E|nr:bacteriodes thetaiotaomicron symbiotic chitinase [Penicillium verhagenii]KAJ5934401.1 bacteriodes thetaiotaomicron symbiotic chitinase [Penicillium verhagenii]
MSVTAWTLTRGNIKQDIVFWIMFTLRLVTALCFRIPTMICCPTDAMPKGCTWEGENEYSLYSGNSSTCGNNKYKLVADIYNDRIGSIHCLINQRSLYYLNPEEEGVPYNLLYYDPPSASENRPVNPADLFEYPNEDHVMYYYKVEKILNNNMASIFIDFKKATDDKSSDPFIFIMIDGDPEAYDESLVDQ